MNIKHPATISNQLFMVILGTLVLSVPASAASYNLSPLPGPDKTVPNGGLIPPSRFSRRPDYRQLDQQQQQQREQQSEAAAQAEKDKLKDQAEQVNEAQQLNQKAVALGKAGRLASAVELHEKAVQFNPTSKQLRINLSAARAAYGQQRLAARDFSTAATLFRKALVAAPDNGLAGKLLSETLKKLGHDPNSADVRLTLGDRLVSTGDFEGAAIEYEAAMQLEGSARTYTKVGDIALHYGQVATATNWYRQGLMKDSTYGPAWRQLGFIQAAQSDYTGAATALRKALIADPKDVAASQVLVELWRRQVAAAPSAQNHLGLAGALQLSGDLNGAANEYRQVQAMDPQNAELEPALKSLSRAAQHRSAEKHFEAAETLFGQGVLRDALSEIGQAVMSEPRNTKYQFLLGQCLESSHNFQGARQAYLSCVLADPENSKEAAARLRDLQSDNATQAAPAVQAGSEAANTTPSTQAHSQNNQAAQVSDALAKGTTLVNPKLAAALDKIFAAESDRDYDSAINILTTLAKANLNDAEIHHRLGVDLLANGQISEAISELRVTTALVPDNKAYAEDLDRAIAIHKRAMATTPSDAVTDASFGGVNQ